MHIKYLLESTLSEAPIGDINYIGNFDKNSSFRKEVDRRLVTNPRMIERMRNAFLRTDYDFQFFFVNHPDGSKHTEVGKIGDVRQGAWTWIEENMPRIAEEFHKLTDAGQGLKEDSLNVIFTNNAASEHAPMTPWIVAHRIAHVMRRNNTRSGNGGLDYYYMEAHNTLIKQTGELLKDFYQIGDQYVASSERNLSRDSYGFGGPERNLNRARETVYKRFWEYLGTFRSARDKNLREYFEMTNECFAQYLIQGAVKFNPPPKSFKANFGVGRGQLWGSLRGDPTEAAEHVEMMADFLNENFNNLLGSNVGGVYVM